MTQLSLNITPLVAYTAEHFLVHAGVSEIVAASEAMLQASHERKVFQCLYSFGPKRSGKTHFSIYLNQRVLKAGKYPRMVEAHASLKWADLLERRPCAPDDVFIVDDAQAYFQGLAPGGSGDFVQFVEALRVEKATLVLLSSEEIESLPCDAHVRSRFLEGRGPSFGPPGEAELLALLEGMARQRGIALTDRKLEFLERRLPRDIGQLEAYLDRVHYISHVTGKPVRFPILGDAL